MKRLLLLAPLLLFSDTINKVEFSGLQHISTITANSISLLHSNDNLDINKVDESIKNFYKYGYFKKIEASFDDGILKYKFEEKPSIIKVKYKNVSEDLKKILKDKIKKGMIFSKNKLEDIRNFIIGYYDSKGEFNTIVNFDKTKYKNGIVVTIEVIKGEEITIKDMHLYGASKINIDGIKSEVVNKNKDWLGILPFRNNGKFNLPALLQDPSNIRNYYLSKGYIDVEVSQPFVVVDFDSNQADLSYKIKEGNRYKVSGIDIVQDKPVLNIKDFKENLHVKKGFYFDVNRLRKDIKQIERSFADKGYAYVKVYPDLQKEKNQVKVIYRVESGEKVYISDVVIEGNIKTLDRIIRRNVYLYPNYLYSLTDKEDTINALKRSGYFDSVDLKEIKVDDTHIKILIKVKEGLTGSLKAGITYNSYSKFGINLSVSERNMFGSGQGLSVNIDKSSKSETYSISLKNPRVFDSKYFLNTSIYNSTYDGYSYDSRKKGISLTTGKKLTRHSNMSITYGYEKLHLTNVEDDTTDYKTDSTKGYIKPAISFNNTDDYFFPQNGMNLSASLEYVGIGGDQKFIKNIENFKIFYSLKDKFDITTILKYKFKLGLLKENGYLPINEKYYLGGIGTVRGFDYGSISPKDSNSDNIGGKMMMVNSIEISTPISLKQKMWLSAFIDNGRIGESDLNIVRSSYGINFAWITPIGPLAFVWAWPINSKAGDELRRFEFSIGSSF